MELNLPMPDPSIACEAFLRPDPAFGPVPFWWWTGDTLDRERLEWQLDRLHSKGIRNVIVSYNHKADGSVDAGDPPVFSEAWWAIFRDMVAACKRRGMKLSFQDYCLLNPVIQEIGAETPEMRGGQLVETSRRVGAGASCVLELEAGCEPLSAHAFPLRGGRVDADGAQDLVAFINEGVLRWSASAGEWLVSLVGFRPHPFDPLHADSGKKVLERFYARFEAHCPGELGQTIAISFQDELVFGARMPLWSNDLFAQFEAFKGYDLRPLMAALWHDIGPVSPKVRIDFSDVATRLLEKHYFIPVFRWHEERGLLFGHDNCGRGAIGRSHGAYGDPFRTMRWYSAPGTDDPRVDGPRAFKGLKVNSSIAHLYGRPRVWCECFHSSGWGTTPAEVIAALHADFIYGATVVNLHGLYYTTHGGWWEWAPPDFHFRQPYWSHCGVFADYVTRLCQTLSVGAHVCDVAMLYPITSIEAGLDARIKSEAAESFSELQAGHGRELEDASEVHAFGLGESLIRAGVDFDFIDFESLERADICDGSLCVAGESYRVLVLPAATAVRFSTLEKARDFGRAGGIVLAYGCLPRASERRGEDDPELDALLAEIFGGGNAGCRLITGSYNAVLAAVSGAIRRDFDPGQSPFQAVHRRDASRDYYFVFNPSASECAATVAFRTEGMPALWDAWTGKREPLEPCSAGDGATQILLRLAPGEGRLVVFDRTDSFKKNPAQEKSGRLGLENTIPIQGTWEFELVPTMDNRFGDFRLPVTDLILGPEARRFRYAEEKQTAENWHLPDFDDASWPTVTAGFGPRFWKLGPIPREADGEAVARALAMLPGVVPSVPVTVDGREYAWEPYLFSSRWGIENDPFLKDWASGPHGLKKTVPDEFIDLTCGTPGAFWFLWTAVPSHGPSTRPFQMGSRSRYMAYLNGAEVLRQDFPLPPGRQSIWGLPHYRCETRRTTVSLLPGCNPLLLAFVEPEGQRMRAYASFVPDEDAPVPDYPALRWFATGGHPAWTHRPDAGTHIGWYRFQSPPGAVSMRVEIRGSRLQAWANGAEVSVETRPHVGTDRAVHQLRLGGAHAESGRIAIRLEQVEDSFGGDAIPEPVAFTVKPGLADVGDWSALGLATYSGAAWYRKTLALGDDPETLKGRRVFLDLGAVAATAEVFWNGQPAGTLLAPPWRVEVTDFCRPGGNRVEILVANTLANHYSVGIPSPYANPAQTVSGLLGPVCLQIFQAKPSL